MTRIINVRECPEWIENAADYFSSCKMSKEVKGNGKLCLLDLLYL